jgi:hypothetical protein
MGVLSRSCITWPMDIVYLTVVLKILSIATAYFLNAYF